MDIRNILVPTDFSEPSKMAVNCAVEMARKFRARLTLLHVLEPFPLAAIDLSQENRAKLETDNQEKALGQLWSILSPEDEDDLDLHAMVRTGPVQREIVTAARECNADIVVLGTHGRGRLGRLILGSTTEGLLRRLPVPILSVCNVSTPVAFNRMLYATDLSESGDTAFAFTLDLAQQLKAELSLVHVLDWMMLVAEGGTPAADTRRIVGRKARRKLAALSAEASRRGIAVQTFLAEGNAPDQILKAAREFGADMILLQTGRKGVVERSLLGSSAERIVREAEIPVLSIPIEAADPAKDIQHSDQVQTK